jgi:formate dehydrogenase (coenzyme F420) beta subunit
MSTFTNENVEQLRQTARRILEDGTVQVVIGYGQAAANRPVYPVFVTQPDKVDQLVWNNQCFQNLTSYLKRKEIRALGKIGIVVKGCDERTLIVLEKESQIVRNEIYVIGMACEGIGDPVAPKCSVCEVHKPRFADAVIGDAHNEPVPAEKRYADLIELMKKTQPERMAHWMEEMKRCLKCYACRQVCPLCYCERCLVDKNRPACVDTSPTLKGNFSYHIMRAFHMAARCIECEECTRACPVGINLRLLNQSLSRAAEENFGYRAGMDPAVDPLVGSYSLKDKEDFIK